MALPASLSHTTGAALSTQQGRLRGRQERRASVARLLVTGIGTRAFAKRSEGTFVPH